MTTPFMLSADEPTIWQTLWDYIVNTFFSDNTATYDNLGFGAGTAISLRGIVFGFAIGMVIAAFAVTADKRILGKFVRHLLRQNVVGRENAKTLYDLGFLTSHTVRRSVRRSVNVRRVVKCVEEEDFEAEQARKREEHEKKREADPSLPAFASATYRIDVESDHFYIPEESKYTAEAKFDKRGTTWLACFIMIIVLLVLCSVLLVAIPYLLSLMNELAGAFSSVGSDRIL